MHAINDCKKILTLNECKIQPEPAEDGTLPVLLCGFQIINYGCCRDLVKSVDTNGFKKSEKAENLISVE